MSNGGIVQNWADMGRVLDHALKDILHVKDASEHKVLLTEPMVNPNR